MVDNSEERMRARERSERERAKAEKNFDGDEREALQEGSAISARMIYEIVRREGLEEMTRPKTSLIFSGIAPAC